MSPPVVESPRAGPAALSKCIVLERHCQAESPPHRYQGAAMQYLLMIYRNESAMLSASKETVERVMAAYTAYTEAMKKAGVYVGANRLKPTASATTVRNPNGKTSVSDGPFAETKEQLGGYYLIDA